MRKTFEADAFIKKAGTNGLFYNAAVKLKADYLPPERDIRLALKAFGFECTTIRSVREVAP